MNRFLRRDGLVLALYLILALVLTYPLVLHLGTHVPGRGVDDPALAWNLWWFKFSIFNLGTSPLQSDYVFYPIGINLVAFTSTFANGLIGLPLYFVFDTIIANNLVVYFALIAGGYGTFLLAREVLARCRVESEWGAVLAGAFYAFGAWHVNYVAAGHFMLISNEWIPFYALCLLRLGANKHKPWRRGALAGLFFVLAAWTELTLALFLAVFTAAYLVYRVIEIATSRGGSKALASQRDSGELGARENSGGLGGTRGGAGRGLLTGLVALGIVAAVGVSPLAVNLFLDFARYGYYLSPGLGRVQVFSAEPISFFIPSAQHPLLGAWAGRLTEANTSYAFIGYAALILAVLGFWSRRRSRDTRFWGALAVFFALLMLGPTLIVGGRSTGIPLPFAVLRAIPFANANRYPVRFNVMLMLALAPLIALGAARLLSARRGAIALGGLAVLLAFEQLAIPIPLSDLRVPAIFQAIRAEPGDFAVLDLPLGWRNSVAIQGKLDYAAQFLQTVHEKRTLGGLTSRNPPFKFQYYLDLPVINSLIALESGREIDGVRREQDRAAAPALLRFFDIRYVEVNRALTDPQVLAYAQDIFPLAEIYRDDERIVYKVTASPAPLDALDLQNETSRLYFDEAWGQAQTTFPDGAGYRWATMDEAHLWLPLTGAERQIRLRLLGAASDQTLAVRLNGQPLTQFTLARSWNNYTATLPAGLAHSGLNELAFSTQTVPIQDAPEGSYAVGETGVVAHVDIAATGAGFDAGRFGEIYVGGRNQITGTRGYHLVALNPRDGSVDRIGSFDTFADPAASEQLAQFVRELPPSEIVAGVAVDDVSRELKPAAVEALHQLGVEGDLRYQFRTGQAFIGVKGAAPGTALEQATGTWPANVAVGKNVAGDRVAFALGGVRLDR
ncbi:MAG: hypothetical protein M1570_18800 [Chloroflexi bacterium]|nr:hypothetical protein [Chloroflexota bacterium]